MRAFIADGSDPGPPHQNIKDNLKNYPYQPGSFGTPIAEALTGSVKFAGEPEFPATKFIEASGRSFNTIPPSDFGYFERDNENVQNEPATSYDVEPAGQLAAVGIANGRDFAPDQRMEKIRFQYSPESPRRNRPCWRVSASRAGAGDCFGG